MDNVLISVQGLLPIIYIICTALLFKIPTHGVILMVDTFVNRIII